MFNNNFFETFSLEPILLSSLIKTLQNSIFKATVKYKKEKVLSRFYF